MSKVDDDIIVCVDSNVISFINKKGNHVGDPILNLNGLSHSSICLAEPGTSSVFVGDTTGILRCWSLNCEKSRKYPQFTVRPEQSVRSLCSNGDFLLTGGIGTVTVWKLPQFKRRMCLTHAEKCPVSAVTFLSTSSAFASASDDIKLWDIKKKSHLRALLSDHTKTITCLQYSNQSLYSGCTGGKLLSYDLRSTRIDVTTEVMNPFKTPDGSSIGISAMCVGESDHEMVVGDSNGTVFLWDSKKEPDDPYCMKIIRTIHGGTRIRQLFPFQDGYVSCGDDGTICFFTLNPQEKNVRWSSSSKLPSRKSPFRKDVGEEEDEDEFPEELFSDSDDEEFSSSAKSLFILPIRSTTNSFRDEISKNGDLINLTKNPTPHSETEKKKKRFDDRWDDSPKSTPSTTPISPSHEPFLSHSRDSDSEDSYPSDEDFPQPTSQPKKISSKKKLRKENEHLRSENEKLQNQIRRQKRRITSQRKKLETLSSASPNSPHSTLKIDQENLKIELENLKIEQDRMSEQRKHLKRTGDRLSVLREELDSDRSDVAKERKHLSKERKRISEERESFELQKDTWERDNREKDKMDEGELVKKVEELRREVRTKDEDLEEVRSEADRLEGLLLSTRAELRSAEDRVREGEERVRVRVRQEVQLESERERKGVMETLAQVQEQLYEEKELREAQEGRREGLEKELECEREKRKILEREIDERGEWEQSQPENNEKFSELEDVLEVEKEKVMTLKEKLKNKEKEKTELLRTLEDQKKLFLEQKRKSSELEEKVEFLTDQNSDLERELQTTKQELEIHNLLKPTADDEQPSSTEITEKKLKEAEKQISKLKEKQKRQQKKLQELRTQRNAAESTAESVRTEISTLRSELEGSNSTISMQTNEIEKKNREIEALQTQLRGNKGKKKPPSRVGRPKISTRGRGRGRVRGRARGRARARGRGRGRGGNAAINNLAALFRGRGRGRRRGRPAPRGRGRPERNRESESESESQSEEEEEVDALKMKKKAKRKVKRKRKKKLVNLTDLLPKDSM